MIKYTINKSFEKVFDDPIWKLEVDSTYNCIAVETRNQETTLPSFSVITFDGDNVLYDFQVESKEWTLEAIQGDYLILKKYGSSSPVQAGIRVIHIPSKECICDFMEYVLKEVYQGYIYAIHRSIPAGLNFYINIQTGDITNHLSDITYPSNEINLPISYQGSLPKFMNEIDYVDQIWLQPLIQDHFLWSYHTGTHSNFNLNLTLSSKNKLFDSKVILKGITKLIPQPYFSVKEHIFFLSSNKKEITTYLVLL